MALNATVSKRWYWLRVTQDRETSPHRASERRLSARQSIIRSQISGGNVDMMVRGKEKNTGEITSAISPCTATDNDFKLQVPQFATSPGSDLRVLRVTAHYHKSVITVLWSFEGRFKVVSPEKSDLLRSQPRFSGIDRPEDDSHSSPLSR